ncbi:hypothetical protein Tco_1578653 [Tanacetum coccineum]
MNSLVLFEVSVFSAEHDEGKHYNIKAYTNKDDPPEEVWGEEWHQCYGERYKNDKKEGPFDGISVEVLFLNRKDEKVSTWRTRSLWGNTNFDADCSQSLGELEAPISKDEIRRAVWDCGENKSPGPDDFTFEFFRKFWNIIESLIFA